MSKKTNQIGSESQDVVNCPERSRLRLIAVLLSSLLLGGAQAQCSFMSGDQRDEDKDNKDEQNKKTGAPANPA
jgi:hypothetical protein